MGIDDTLENSLPPFWVTQFILQLSEFRDRLQIFEYAISTIRVGEMTVRAGRLTFPLL